MSALLDIYLKRETLETLLKTVDAKQEKGVAITVSVNNDTNEYGQNVSAFVSQTKEQREAGTKKYYVGNGKVFWNDGQIVNAKKKDAPATETAIPADDNLGLPF
jgi:hypothetical protein